MLTCIDGLEFEFIRPRVGMEHIGPKSCFASAHQESAAGVSRKCNPRGLVMQTHLIQSITYHGTIEFFSHFFKGDQHP
jgi:hypothetical protein